MRRLFLSGWLVTVLACSAPAIGRVAYTPEQYLKNYAVSACIAGGYASSAEVADDAKAAAGGYLELGSFDIEAYNEAAALAKTYLSKHYVSHNDSGKTPSLTLMKCIDLYHSKELEQLVRHYSDGA